MRRTTDYMFVLEGSPVRLFDVVACTVAIATLTGASLGFVTPWLEGPSVWMVVALCALAAAKSLSAVCDTAREHDERGGCRFPGGSGSPPSSILVALLLAAGAAFPGWGPVLMVVVALVSLCVARRGTSVSIR